MGRNSESQFLYFDKSARQERYSASEFLYRAVVIGIPPDVIGRFSRKALRGVVLFWCRQEKWTEDDSSNQWLPNLRIMAPANQNLMNLQSGEASAPTGRSCGLHPIFSLRSAAPRTIRTSNLAPANPSPEQQPVESVVCRSSGSGRSKLPASPNLQLVKYKPRDSSGRRFNGLRIGLRIYCPRIR